MSTATRSRPRQVTPEEMEALPDRKGYELLDGVLTERKVSVRSSKVAVRITRRLGNFVEATNSGSVLDASIGLRIFPDRPRHVPRPDVAFVSYQRLPADAPSTGFLLVPPELIVEVISPGDLAVAIERKVGDYLGAGVLAVWVVYPESRRVHAFQGGGRHAVLSEGDTLEGGEALPGFSVPVSELFAQ